MLLKEQEIIQRIKEYVQVCAVLGSAKHLLNNLLIKRGEQRM
jgi:hypothetical protein